MRPRNTPKRLPLVVLTVGLAVSAFAFVEIRSFFNRPGETALSIIPGDALGVLVVDFQPGIHQIGTFRKLSSSSDQADLQKSLDSIDALLGPSAWVKQVFPYLRRSGLVALLPAGPVSSSADSNESPVVVLPVVDPAGLNTLLQQHLTYDDAHKSYSMKGQTGKVAILGNDLVIAQGDYDLGRVRACIADPSRSFASSPGYQTARKSIDSDANIMVFISDKGFQAIGSKTGSASTFRSTGWFAAGVAMRDDGVGFSCVVPMNSETWRPYKEIAAMPPVRKDLYDRLPAGAHSVSAISEPIAFWRLAQDVAPDADSRGKMVDAAVKVNREAGVNLNDLAHCPLNGTLITAAYGHNCLLEFDDSNGAKPSDSAAAVVAWVQRNLDPSDRNIPLFTTFDLNGVQAFTLSKELRQKWMDKYLNSQSPSQRQQYSDVTVAYATVNGAVLVATSEELLGRAIKAYRGEGPLLSSDTAFASFSPIASESPQIFSEVDVRKLAATAESNVPWDTLPPQGKAPARGAFDMLKAIQRPGIFSFHAGDNAATLHMFIPMDYDSISKFVKDQQKAFGNPGGRVTPVDAS